MRKNQGRMLHNMYYMLQDVVRENDVSHLQTLLKHERHPGPMFRQVRLIDMQGKTVLSSERADWSEISLPENIHQRSVDDMPFMTTIQTPKNSKQITSIAGRVTQEYILQICIMPHKDFMFFEIFIKIALILLPISFALVGLAGWFVSRQAMLGVKQVTQIASSINKGALDLRVELGNPGQEIQELASTFNTMLTKIQTLIRELEDVTNNIAHDLRSPLTRMRGMIETTMRDNESVANYKQMSADLIEEIERLQEMINTMLAIASAEAGIDPAEMGTLDMNQILTDAVELFSPMAEDKQQQIQLKLPDHPLTVSGSRHRLQRVIANLLDNATKFTPEHGKISITASQPNKQTLEIQVRDNGPGMEADILPHIFDRFYRGDQSRTFKGNGLGLSYVRSIVQAHHGQIRIVCPEDGGSLFTIELPASDPA